MISLFYIAYLVSVSSLPIKLLPQRNANQSLVGLRVTTSLLPGYWMTGNIPSGDIENDGICGSFGVVAMPKTAAESDAIETILNDDSNRQTWNGKYAWLGGKLVFVDGVGCWTWFDGEPITWTNWDGGEPGTTGDGSGDPVPKSFQPFLGLVRKAGENQGKWHDFHGQDQSSNGAEETTGQVAVCQQTLEYYVTAAVPTNGADQLSDDVCTFNGKRGELAMPKTAAEQDLVRSLFNSGLGAPTISGLAWGGTYLWLGGHYNGNSWEWNDGTPVDDGNWDTNEPGTIGAYDASDPLAYQPLLGIKRANGKFHDFHGQDQGDDGKESSVGFLALCKGYRSLSEV